MYLLLTVLFGASLCYLAFVAYLVNLSRRSKEVAGRSGGGDVADTIERIFIETEKEPEEKRCPVCGRSYRSGQMEARIVEAAIQRLAAEAAELVDAGGRDRLCLALYGMFLLHRWILNLLNRRRPRMRALRILVGLNLALARRVAGLRS